MAFIRPVCTSCGATLPGREEGEREFQCDYCGTRFQWKGDDGSRKRGAPEPERPRDETRETESARVIIEHTIRHEQHQHHRKKGGCLGCLVSLVFMVGMIGVAVAIFVQQQFGGQWQKVVETIKAGKFEEIIETATSPRRWFIWDTFAGTPVAAEVGGKPAVIGRARQFPEDHLFMVALALENGEVLWKIGPLGTYSEGYQHVAVAVAGDVVAVSDPKANLTLYNRDTGQAVESLSLSDKAERVCTNTDGSGFWVETVDKRGLDITKLGTTSPNMEAPPGCGHRWERAPHINERPPESAPEVAGFKPLRVWEEDKIWLAAGVKHPGSEVPRLVRFGKILKSPLWDRVLPEVDPNLIRSGSFKLDVLHKGIYVAVYGTGNKPWRLCAWNAETGERLWDKPLRVLFAVDDIKDLVVYGDYIVLLRTSSLEIWSVKRGEMVTKFGNETYEDEH